MYWKVKVHCIINIIIIVIQIIVIEINESKRECEPRIYKLIQEESFATGRWSLRVYKT